VREAWAVVRRANELLWDHMFLLVLANLVWFGMQLLVLPGPPATLALFTLAHRLAQGQDSNLGDFFRSMWRGALRGWLWALVGGAGIFLLVGDVVLAGQLLAESPIRIFAQGFFVVLLFLWMAILFLAIPFSFEQQRPALLQALRNAFVLFAQNGLFSITLLAVALVVAGVSTLLTMGPWFFISMAFMALLASCAVRDRVEKYRAPEGKPDGS